MTCPRGLAALLVAGTLVLAPRDALTYSAGAPAGFAGDVSGSAGPPTCAVCHSSFGLNTGAGGVAIEAPAQFAPGETVQITVSVDNQTPPSAGGVRRQGFEVAVKDPATGQHVGALQIVDASDTKFAQGDARYVTHTAGGTSRASWTVAWIAPASAAPASVRIYAAGNAASGGDGSANDHIYTATSDLALASVTTAPPPAASPFDLSAPMPNPVQGTTARLALTVEQAGDVSVRLVDGRGRAVRPLVAGAWSAGVHDLALRLGGLAPGLYFIVAEGAGGTRTQPLVVVR